MDAFRRRDVVLLILVILFVINFVTFRETRTTESSRTRPALTTLTWNIAAINNNPFEYWITYEDPNYNDFMLEVQRLIERPGQRQKVLSSILDDASLRELTTLMKTTTTWSASDVDQAGRVWREEYRDRLSVDEFLKDANIGLKRLVSMPDRATNTMNLAYGGKRAYRPVVHNCYRGHDLNDMNTWWTRWKEFMFKTPLMFDGASTAQLPIERLSPIRRSKYPAVTASEERISLPLQTILMAAFDGTLVSIANEVARSSWQTVRQSLCRSLNDEKNRRLASILRRSYGKTHVVFLQEVAGAFRGMLQDSMPNHLVLASANINLKRDQNSIILLRRDMFDEGSVHEITSSIIDMMEAQNPTQAVPVSNGDVFAVTVRDRSGKMYMLASFHGDTNGLASVPVVSAVSAVYRRMYPNTKLLFGLDANTYEHAKPGKQQDVLAFARHYVNEGLTSCWGDRPDPTEHTTYNARTFLQPQLNKASRREDIALKGDVNPKDFVLFNRDDFVVRGLHKDNTGNRQYVEGMVFPTPSFPSDHGVLFVELDHASSV